MYVITLESTSVCALVALGQLEMQSNCSALGLVTQKDP